MIFLKSFSHHFYIIFALFYGLSFLLQDSSQQSCDPTRCTVPDCRCSGLNIPGGFHPEEIPQIVLLAFDDAVNWDNWGYYSKLFPADGSRKNPNGCPIAMTLFVSHNYTDYCMIRKLHRRGIEIADHSLTHQVIFSLYMYLKAKYWVHYLMLYKICPESIQIFNMRKNGLFRTIAFLYRQCIHFRILHIYHSVPPTFQNSLSGLPSAASLHLQSS